MFKSIEKINSLLSEIKKAIDSINTLDTAIEVLEAEITSESNSIKIEMSNYIDNTRNRISSLNILNNERNRFSNSDNFVNFSSDNHLSDNAGLNIDHELQHLISETTDITSHSDFIVDYKKAERIFSVIFQEERSVNHLLYSFFDDNGNTVIPTNIFFDGDYKNVLYRDWMDKMSKTSINPTFTNRYYFAPTFLKTIHFKFENDIDAARALLNISKLTYNNVGYATFAFECPSKIGFSINKLDHTENIGISYLYSLDNVEFFKIKTTDETETDINHGTVLFDTVTNENAKLYIKIERDNSVMKTVGNVKNISSTNIINGTDKRHSDISFDLGTADITDSYSIVVTNSVYELYKDSVPDYFQKTTDGLIEINKKYILEENNITDLKLLSLKNQNTVNSISGSSYIFKTSENIFYMPSILASSGITFIYNTYEEQEILKTEDYTPLVFDFSINYADGES